MSEEEETIHASSSSKMLTDDANVQITDSTSIRNIETNSSIDQQIENNDLTSFFKDLLQPDNKNDNSDHNLINESEKEKEIINEPESNTIEKENNNHSSSSHHSSSSRSKKTVNNDSTFDSSSIEVTNTTVIITTTTTTSQNHNSREDDTIMTASKSLLEKGTLPPFSIQGKVLQYLKSESLQAVQECDYPRAAKIEKGINKIVQETYRRRQGNRELRKEHKVDKKAQKANYLMKKEEEESQNIYNNFLKEEDEKLNAIKARHKQELEMLKEEWNKPETLLPFNKSSQNLLSLRRSQKVLALSKRYEEAEKVKKHADELQKKELNEAKIKANLAYKKAKSTLIDQHKKELECFNDHKKRLETFLDLERLKAVTPYKNMASFYERQRSARSLPNGKPAPKANYLSSNGSLVAKRATSMFDALPPTDPEIVAGVSKFKATPETHPLGLTSIMKKKANGKSEKRTKSVASSRRPKRKTAKTQK